jgi:hypothetical protein
VAETLRTYEELAWEGSRFPGSIVAGLRGESALNAGLKVLSVNGYSPLEKVFRSMYPLQYMVHLYVKEIEDDKNPIRKGYVESLKSRIAVDEQVLKMLSDRERHLDSGALSA